MVINDHYGGNRVGFFHWLTRIRLSRLIGLLLVILIVVPLVAHYYISNLALEGEDGSEAHRSRRIHEENSSTRADLRFQIDDLRRIKASVNNELRDLENKRQHLHAEINGYNTHIEELKSAYERTHYELEQLKVTIENTKLELTEIVPHVQAPRRILPPLDDLHIAPPAQYSRCHMHSCFDFSRCSVTSGLPVYLYESDSVSGSDHLDMFIKLSVNDALRASPHYTSDGSVACVYIVLVGDIKAGLHNVAWLETKLRNLAYWNGDGRNHILLNVARYHSNHNVFEGVNTGRAMVVQSSFTMTEYREGFDMVIPPSLGLSSGDVWEELPPIVPAIRTHLLSFHGDLPVSPHMGMGQNSHRQGGTQSHNPLNIIPKFVKMSSRDPNSVENLKNGANNFEPLIDNLIPEKEGERSVNNIEKIDTNPNVMPHFRNLLSLDDESSKLVSLLDLDYSIISTLKRLATDYPSDNLSVRFSCDHTEQVGGVAGEWCLCGSDTERNDLLKQSTFSLILAPTNISVVSTTLTQIRIYEALKYGAIPVILGDHTRLPFSELLSWRRAIISLPKARITELHFILRSLSDADILEMRRQGRIFWETYFGTTQSIIKTVLSTLRMRLNIAAPPVKEAKNPSVFPLSFTPLTEEIADVQLQADDILGPIEAPFPSIKYQRNFSQLTDWYNLVGDPFHTFPFTPHDPVMPGEAKFKGSGMGFRPIGKGAGGAGKEFSEALGGNIPREQFTIVILTFEREAVLIDSIARLKGLPHLNKVLVIWNNPQPPAADLRWPDIGVKVLVVRTAKNSLNNRFLPYEDIETEAVLSIDDDAHLRHDEIIFGFRVWRENRERIVGFPGRFHAWDLKEESWMYNSNYSCELSMVLTGAAFFHKYYMYLYSYVMPQAIRDKVDEYLNCEDLAMNFLVSHITRKAPIKVTSRWTFRCPGCPNALSVDETHFHERHKCINFFVRVYGYMPLLYTQYRVDSVLFKTRIPHDKQKCFKFI